MFSGKDAGRCSVEGLSRIFPERSTVTFRLLKTLRTYVEGLEVSKNVYWEWENAIFEGCEVFFRLRQEKQGTVHVDLENRRLSFSPEVAAELRGVTVGLGMAGSPMPIAHELAKVVLLESEFNWARELEKIAETVATKKAVLAALGLSKDDELLWSQLEIRLLDKNRVSVKASGQVQDQAWSVRAVDYKAAFTTSAGEILCTAVAIADITDLTK